MSETVYTPDERALASDPVVRQVGAKTQSITLADEASYNLGRLRQDGATRVRVPNSGFDPGTYRVQFESSSYPGGGEFTVDLRFPALPTDADWDKASDGAGADVAGVRAASMAYDHTGGNIEQELTVTTESAHNLEVGQYVSIVMDSDLTGTTAFATGSTISAITAEYRVEFVGEADQFSVSFTAGTADDADDAALDANVFVMPKADVFYEKTIRDITLADTESSAAMCGDWDGQLFLINRTEDVSVRFVVDAGAVTESVGDLDAAASLDYDTDGSDGSQGVEIASNALNIYNEDAATNTYDLVLKNSPVTSGDRDGYLCLYVSDRNLILKNRLGASVTASISRVA